MKKESPEYSSAVPPLNCGSFRLQEMHGKGFIIESSCNRYADISAASAARMSVQPVQPALLETLLASPHRTTNADEADFFYVPTFEACARFQADSAPHTDMQVYLFRLLYLTDMVE